MALAPDTAAAPGHAHELARDVVRKWFGDSGRYARLGVAGDGSCFYHSVCAILNTKDYLHASAARQAEIAHEFRCDFQRRFDESTYDYLAAGLDTGKSFASTRVAMCSPKVWADEVMIKHAAGVLGINLIFVNMARDTLYCGVHGAPTLRATSPPKRGRGAASGGGTKLQPTGVIAWVNKMHFEPIVRLEEVDADGGAAVRGLFTPATDAQDAAMVTHLMTAYTAQCGDGVHAAHVL